MARSRHAVNVSTAAEIGRMILILASHNSRSEYLMLIPIPMAMAMSMPRQGTSGPGQVRREKLPTIPMWRVESDHQPSSVRSLRYWQLSSKYICSDADFELLATIWLQLLADAEKSYEYDLENGFYLHRQGSLAAESSKSVKLLIAATNSSGRVAVRGCSTSMLA